MIYKDLKHSVQRRLDQMHSGYHDRLNIVIYYGQPLDRYKMEDGQMNMR